jgi:hypothetical protein
MKARRWNVKGILGSSRAHYLARLCIFLMTAALIAGLVGCDGCNPPPSQNLEIRTWYDLDAVRDNLAGHHTLMNDLDSATAGYEELASPRANAGKGWGPIGWGYWASGPPWIRLVGEPFTGSFDGQGHEIRDLFISYSGEPQAGLLGCVGKGGIIKNLGVVNATLTFSSDVQGLVRLDETAVRSLDVAPIFGVGILVGFSMGSVIESYSSGTVSARVDVSVGGLVGQNTGTVNNCYSTANVTGTWGIGGLVGSNGDLIYGGTLSNCYSTGSVTGNAYVGGLVGKNEGSAPGANFRGRVRSSFWDVKTSGQATSDGGAGKTTEQMKNITAFLDAGWDIVAVSGPGQRNPAYIWNIVDGVTYPFLSWQA